MSEPDRFDKQAEDVFRQFANGTSTLIAALAAALRAAASEALERAAQICDDHAEYFAAKRIRALIPPAAAPAADYDPIAAPIPAGDMNGPHGPPPAAEDES